MIHNNILKKVGNTPLVKIEPKGFDDVNIYAKLEHYNPMGSVKDRSASYILEKTLDSGEINKDTVIIESSSGNFGVALAAYCKEYGLKFYCIVDPNISPTNEYLIKKLSTKMIKIFDIDENGGYLLNRIRKVKQLQKDIPNSYWVNQYGNPYNAEAYRETLGKEICDEMGEFRFHYIGQI